MHLLRRAGAAAACSRFWRLCFRAVAGIKPAVTLQAEGGGRDQFLYGGFALRALAGRWIREFLAQFKLVITGCATVFVHRHNV